MPTAHATLENHLLFFRTKPIASSSRRMSSLDSAFRSGIGAPAAIELLSVHWPSIWTYPAAFRA